MDDKEVRLRLVEAAAKSPIVHKDGPAAGVLAVAQAWAEWVAPPPTRTAPERPPGSVTMVVGDLF